MKKKRNLYLHTMPNYCFCNLVLKAPCNILKDIVEHRLDFQHYVPVTDEEDVDECRETWGTRSSCPMDLELAYEPDYDPNTLKAKFMTAWAPPSKFLEALLQLFPCLWIKLDFEIEGGLGCGLWILYTKNGQIEEKYLGWEEPVFESSESKSQTETHSNSDSESKSQTETDSESEQVHAEPHE